MDPKEKEEGMDVEDSTSSDSDNEEEDDQVLLAKAADLEAAISSNKMNYEAHLELVEVYNSLLDFNSLRAAYERFAECYPLTPTIWLAWIRQEITASTSENPERVFELFERAVEDYLSVELWMEYAQFSLGAGTIDRTRGIIDRGLNSVGLHAANASLLWDTLREIELLQCSLLEQGTEEYSKQTQRLFDVYKRQLSVPLLDMTNTYAELEEWLKTLPEGSSIDIEPVEWGYKIATKRLEVYEPFERRLMKTGDDGEKHKVYQEYIKACEDPCTIICLYERAVAALCLHPNVWLEYCDFAFALGEPALKVCTKALRNCPWSEDLWIYKLRVLEHLQSEPKAVLEAFEQGLASATPPGLELWLSYLEYAYRCGPQDKLDKLFEQARHQFNFDTDPSSKTTKFFAGVLAKRGDMAQVRRLWKAILQRPENRACAALWMEFVHLETAYGDDANEIRSLYRRAVFACEDWPQYVADQWLQHERLNGTLEEVAECRSKCAEALAKATAKTLVAPAPQPKGKKRKIEDEDGDHKVKVMKVKTVSAPKKVPVVRDPEITVFVSNLHPQVTEEQLKDLFPNAVNLELVLDRKGASRCFGYIQFKMAEEAAVALARDREPLDGRPVFISNCKPDRAERRKVFNYSADVENNKVFVKGLPKSKTQQDLEGLFKPFGAVAVRLVLQKSGQSKGLAYIEFKNAEAADACVRKTDRMVVDEHTISVAISAPPAKNRSGSSKSSEEPTRHARSQLEVPKMLVPRSVAVKTTSEIINKKKKSNADFRNMFLKSSSN